MKDIMKVMKFTERKLEGVMYLAAIQKISAETIKRVNQAVGFSIY
jgi:hypothetical protein